MLWLQWSCWRSSVKWQNDLFLDILNLLLETFTIIDDKNFKESFCWEQKKQYNQDDIQTFFRYVASKIRNGFLAFFLILSLKKLSESFPMIKFLWEFR